MVLGLLEGPIQARYMTSIFQKESSEKAAYHADLTHGHEVEVNDNDMDIPYYEANERYD